MQIDMSEWPLIWMTPHDEHHPEDAQHLEEMRRTTQTLMGSKERFVLIATHPPTLEDFQDQSREEKRLRAEFVKTYRKQFSQLCAAMILVGSFDRLPLMVQKAVQGASRMIGVPLVFAPSVAEARVLASQYLGTPAS